MSAGLKQQYPCGCETRAGMESISWIKCPVHEAAPDVLEALADLLERCGTVSPFGGESSVKAVRAAGKFLASLDRARAVIAKTVRR